MANFIASKNRQYLTCQISAIGRNWQKSPEITIAATDTPSDFRRHKQQPVVKNATFYSYNQPVNLHIYIGKNLPGINLFIILFLRLTSSDPGTQSSSLSSLLSFELSPSWPKYSVLLLFTGVLRGRPWSPAGTTGTGSPENEDRLVNMQNE